MIYCVLNIVNDAPGVVNFGIPKKISIIPVFYIIFDMADIIKRKEAVNFILGKAKMLCIIFIQDRNDL